MSIITGCIMMYLSNHSTSISCQFLHLNHYNLVTKFKLLSSYCLVLNLQIFVRCLILFLCYRLLHLDHCQSNIFTNNYFTVTELLMSCSNPWPNERSGIKINIRIFLSHGKSFSVIKEITTGNWFLLVRFWSVFFLVCRDRRTQYCLNLYWV